jgi:hypothetical protein
MLILYRVAVSLSDGHRKEFYSATKGHSPYIETKKHFFFFAFLRDLCGFPTAKNAKKKSTFTPDPDNYRPIALNRLLAARH